MRVLLGAWCPVVPPAQFALQQRRWAVWVLGRTSSQRQNTPEYLSLGWRRSQPRFVKSVWYTRHFGCVRRATEETVFVVDVMATTLLRGSWCDGMDLLDVDIVDSSTYG